MKLKDLLFVLQAESRVQVVTEDKNIFLNVFRSRGFGSDLDTLKKFRSFCRRFNYMDVYNCEVKRLLILDRDVTIVLDDSDGAIYHRFGNYTPR